MSMAGSKKKKKKVKSPKPSAPAPKRATKRAPAKSVKMALPARKAAAKKRVAAPKPQRAPSATPSPSVRAFADQVRDAHAGTGLWFRVAEGIEHAVLRKRGGEGTILALTDAGVEAVLPIENVFETAAEARAHGRVW